MRELDNLIGKIVTVKSATGLEFIGTMTELNREENYISLAEPRAITLTSSGDVNIMPYTLTANNSLVGINLSSLLTVTASMDETATDYRNLIISDHAQQLQETRDAELETQAG